MEKTEEQKRLARLLLETAEQLVAATLAQYHPPDLAVPPGRIDIRIGDLRGTLPHVALVYVPHDHDGDDHGDVEFRRYVHGPIESGFEALDY